MYYSCNDWFNFHEQNAYMYIKHILIVYDFNRLITFILKTGETSLKKYASVEGDVLQYGDRKAVHILITAEKLFSLH